MNARTVLALSGIMLLLSLSAFGAVPPKMEENTKAEPLSAVAPAVIRSLKTSVTRKQVVTALLANAQTKPVIQEEMSKRGFGSRRITTLATKPLPRSLSGGIAHEVAQMRADDADYSKIDWSSGINMTPAGIPTYGSGKWKIATLTVKNATFTTSQPNVMTTSTQEEPYGFQFVTCDLELPLEPAMYAVTVRLVRSDGRLDSRWVTHEKSGHRPIEASWHDISDKQCWVGSQIELVTCPEIKGYVGLISANPVGTAHFENTGMRKVTSRFTLSFYPYAQLTTTPLNDQVFGGITITRL